MKRHTHVTWSGLGNTFKTHTQDAKAELSEGTALCPTPSAWAKCPQQPRPRCRAVLNSQQVPGNGNSQDTPGTGWEHAGSFPWVHHAPPWGSLRDSQRQPQQVTHLLASWDMVLRGLGTRFHKVL